MVQTYLKIDRVDLAEKELLNVSYKQLPLPFLFSFTLEDEKAR